MTEEIEYGLRNSISRGISLESAVQSFINAGYNPSLVREAADLISSGATSISLSELAKDSTQSMANAENNVKTENTTTEVSNQQLAENNSPLSKVKLVIISLIILILLGIGGFVSYMIIKGPPA